MTAAVAQQIIAAAIAATQVDGLFASTASAVVSGQEVTLVTVTTVGDVDSDRLTAALEIAGLIRPAASMTHSLCESEDEVLYRTQTAAWRFPVTVDGDRPLSARQDGTSIVLTYPLVLDRTREVRIPCGLTHAELLAAL